MEEASAKFKNASTKDASKVEEGAQVVNINSKPLDSEESGRVTSTPNLYTPGGKVQHVGIPIEVGAKPELRLPSQFLLDAVEEVILLDVNKLGDGQVEHELTSIKSIAKSPVYVGLAPANLVYVKLT